MNFIVFNEINAKIFQEETQAVHEVKALNNLEIRRFNFNSYVSYAIIK